MVQWIKDKIDKYNEITLHCEYNTKNSDVVFVTVTIYSEGIHPTYSVKVCVLSEDKLDRKSAPPHIRGLINENLEQLLDEAIVLIYHATNKPFYVVEDSSGIYNEEINNLYEKLLVVGMEYEYAKVYNQTIQNFKEPKKFCNSNIFFTRIAKNEKRYNLKEAMHYLKLNQSEFRFKERSKEELSDPIISVSTPDITRKFGNNDKNTFDFVAIEILLRRNLNIDDMEAYVKQNLDIFNNRALQKIAEDKKYKSFNVPVKYLKLYSIGTHMKSSIRMMYELGS
ncbi:hypothetical protein SAMN05216349_1616 [Oribacterium sp. KHPX15]|uniref:hypothetical protein n=1 Tax=Oribacterium sp. KHPX15 TaxID=1855342 RepID=UPI00089CDAF7|nr:hypothetical protein [Oribacterium sp. KHPX15]SEA94179.1 hypothetical protein SAMN05216349_1616 [Oribacterium sp. KHPX15]